MDFSKCHWDVLAVIMEMKEKEEKLDKIENLSKKQSNRVMRELQKAGRMDYEVGDTLADYHNYGMGRGSNIHKDILEDFLVSPPPPSVAEKISGDFNFLIFNQFKDLTNEEQDKYIEEYIYQKDIYAVVNDNEYNGCVHYFRPTRKGKTVMRNIEYHIESIKDLRSINKWSFSDIIDHWFSNPTLSSFKNLRNTKEYGFGGHMKYDKINYQENYKYVKEQREGKLFKDLNRFFYNNQYNPKYPTFRCCDKVMDYDEDYMCMMPFYVFYN